MVCRQFKEAYMDYRKALHILIDHLNKLEDSGADEELIDAMIAATEIIGEKIDNEKRKPAWSQMPKSLSANAIDFIQYSVENGGKNPYHSIMSIMDNQRQRARVDVELAKLRYRQLHPVPKKYRGALNEVALACYDAAKRKGWVNGQRV